MQTAGSLKRFRTPVFLVWSARPDRIMDNTNDRATLRTLAIAAALLFILFIGLSVGYRWGAAAALKNNASEAAAATVP